MTDQDAHEPLPFPDRDPADEPARLQVTSPSHPLEVDHFLFKGRRDWSQGVRILVAGGGTGDALIQMAQVLTTAGKPYEIIYLDTAINARAIAEARAAARGLTGVRFETGSLLDAARFDLFDYIDCAGVLHHLADPQAGIDALAGALASGGGIGLSVAAPFGREGVLALQKAFAETIPQGDPVKRLAAARAVFARIPQRHAVLSNPHLRAQIATDAGFYDLLLKGPDQPFAMDQLMEALTAAGLAATGLPQAHLYDLARFFPEDLEDISPVAAMALAEKLDGTIRSHALYATHAGLAEGRVAQGLDAADVPHLRGASGLNLAKMVAAKGALSIALSGARTVLPVPASAAPILAGITGHKTLGQLREAVGLDTVSWGPLWSTLHRDLTRFGLLRYSRLLVS